MKLSFFSVENFRSITKAYKIDLENLTVLLGKNNEGKTNILKALIFGMTILERIGRGAIGTSTLRREYDWSEDFPIKLQRYNRLKDKSTKIRFDFSMTPSECQNLLSKIGSNINGEISIYIKINSKNEFLIEVPKKGKNTRALSKKKKDICSFITENFKLQYVPAIRSQEDAYKIISELITIELDDIQDEEYFKAIDYIGKKQEEKINHLSDKIQGPLKDFLPNINSIRLKLNDEIILKRSQYSYRRNLDISVDDGVPTDLMNKGDGVKSLFTIAMLSQISLPNGTLIVIDEPENHLHPDGIRFISQVLWNISKKCQVLVSSHNPIFVNRHNIKSNIIVDKGMAIEARLLDDIRKNLGVSCADNLMYADYIVIVEGPTDRTFLEKYLSRDSELHSYIKNNKLMIRNIGGTNNLNYELQGLERFCCSYLILLDNDSAGLKAKNTAITNLRISDDAFRFFSVSGMPHSELEDLYSPTYYQDFLSSEGYDITRGLFKNKTKKWADRISDLAIEQGTLLSKEQIDVLKEKLVAHIATDIENSLSDAGKHLLSQITKKIKDDIEMQDQ